MGVSASTLRQLIKEEFQRVACDKSYLTLDEIQQYHIRNLGADVDPEHIGVLFDLDRYSAALTGQGKQQEIVLSASACLVSLVKTSAFLHTCHQCTACAPVLELA